jgi:hypothetical protein
MRRNIDGADKSRKNYWFRYPAGMLEVKKIALKNLSTTIEMIWAILKTCFEDNYFDANYCCLVYVILRL